MTEVRKGARSVAAVTPEIRRGLSDGTLATMSLSEQFCVDFPTLMKAAAQDLPKDLLAAVEAAESLGIVRRMAFCGAMLQRHYGNAGLERFLRHPSDTVRGWACYAIGTAEKLTLNKRLEAIRPLADDPHFGVREWAWIALRPAIAEDVELAAKLLLPWAKLKTLNLRRYAVEILRCRGVWTFHIQALKDRPELALAHLDHNKADGSKYVQDSVANYLNDAAKSKPDWVRGIVAAWRKSPVPATERICGRALRSLNQHIPPSLE